MENQQRIAENPENAASIINHYKAVKDAAIDQRQNYIKQDINQLQVDKGLIPAHDSKTLGKIDQAIQTRTEELRAVPDQFSGFDLNAYIDPHNSKQAEAQIGSLLLDRHVSGIVGSMGLDKTNVTYKQDAAAISMLNMAANERKQLDANKWKALEFDQKNPPPQKKKKKKFFRHGQILPNAGH